MTARPGARPRLRLLGVGAMNSPRFAPAGLLLEFDALRVAFDGGPGAEPDGPLDAWLVADVGAELGAAVRRLARARGLAAGMAGFARGRLVVEARPVEHTVRPTVGYRIVAAGTVTAWAPEFSAFPAWAAGADLLFADAAGWDRPIRFRGGAGGHMAVLDVADVARRANVRRLVFAHIGRPTIRALDRGLAPPFGEIGVEGAWYEPGAAA